MTPVATLTLKVFVTLYLVYGLLKFLGLLVRKEEVKLQWLARVYRGDARAVSLFDAVMLVFIAVLVGLQFAAGVEYLSFTTGLLVGMTLVQIFFHRFNEAVPAEKSPEPPATALKLMAYAIQLSPAKAWREMVFMSLLMAWELFMLLEVGFHAIR